METTLDLRSNRDHSEIVDRALALQRRAGSVCALEYLQAHSVRPPVIERVLLHPHLRRQLPSREVMHKN